MNQIEIRKGKISHVWCCNQRVQAVANGFAFCDSCYLSAMQDYRRIALISHASALEGAERSLLGIIDSLLEKRWKILVVIRDDGLFAEALKSRDVEVYRSRYGWWRTDGNFFNNDWSQQNYLAARDICQQVQHFGAEMVYTNTAVIAAGAVAAAMANLPHFWHIRELAHGAVFDTCRAGMAAIGRVMTQSSNAFIFNSETTAKSWKTHLSGYVKSEVIYNYIPPIKALPASVWENDNFYIALIGSILPIKAQDEALPALAALLKDGINATVLMVGPKRNERFAERLTARVDKLNLTTHVRFLGFVENPYDVCAECQVSLICGNEEGFGRVAAESMLRGMLVVAAKGGATDELIKNGQTGLTFDKGNVESLHEALKKAFMHKEQSMHLALAGQTYIRQLTSDENTHGRLNTLFLSQSGLDANPLHGISGLFQPFRKHSDYLPYISWARCSA